MTGHPCPRTTCVADQRAQVEFVIDKRTKAPFPRQANVAQLVHETGLNDECISLYPGTGTKDGISGDHILLAPAYNLGSQEIEQIALKVRNTIRKALTRSKLQSYLPGH